MSCANCEQQAEPAYTLRAHVVDNETKIDLRFCSSECLQAWV